MSLEWIEMRWMSLEWPCKARSPGGLDYDCDQVRPATKTEHGKEALDNRALFTLPGDEYCEMFRNFHKPIWVIV